jgi:hypothetical protein
MEEQQIYANIFFHSTAKSGNAVSPDTPFGYLPSYTDSEYTEMFWEAIAWIRIGITGII